MPRWVLGLIMGSLAVCVGCVALVYLVWQRSESAVSNEMARVIATQVVASIDASDGASGQLVLTDIDLDVNNVVTISDECGFNVSNQGTQIFGVTTEITPAGITFDCAGGGYSTVPVIEEERVELTEITASNPAMRFVFPKDKLEKGIEEGINTELETKGLRPISLTLDYGELTIETVKADS